MFQTSLRHKDKYKINTTEQIDSMHNNTQQSSNHKQTQYKSNNKWTVCTTTHSKSSNHKQTQYKSYGAPCLQHKLNVLIKLNNLVGHEKQKWVFIGKKTSASSYLQLSQTINSGGFID